jgi:predicted O-linked N-acetylglucosamine transferase (SPINDLY family)
MNSMLRWLRGRLAPTQDGAAAAEAPAPATDVQGPAPAAEAPHAGPSEPARASSGPMALYRTGRFAEAEAAAAQALAAEASDPQAAQVLALLALDQGRALEALRRLTQALESHPDHPSLLSLHGQAMAAAGRRKEAVAALEQARSRLPGSGEPLLALARVALANRREPEAFDHLVAATKVQPSLADAHHELARLLRARGRLDEAAGELERAIASDPDHADALSDLGSLYRERGQPDKGAAYLERALKIRPDLDAATYDLGLACVDRRRWVEASALLRAYAERHPKDADAQYWLANASMGAGNAGEARTAYLAALRANGDLVQARWGFAVAQLPAVPQSAAEQLAAPEAFRAEVAKLRAWFRSRPNAEGQRAVGALQPFYIAYIPQNHRATLAEYGALCTQLMGNWARKAGAPKPAFSGAPRRRIGIVSAHLNSHSVWHAIVKGWVEYLDPAKFELQLFHVGAHRDAETEWAGRRATRLVQGAGDWMAWARTISESTCDALIYPEIGMDSTTTRLATLRLAPVQLASWGHPITTGLPTIDAYLSAEAFESEAADGHYTEKLIRLPRLGCCYRPFGTAPATANLAAFGIGPGDKVLLCAGTPFKYAPRDDQVLVDIARRCAPCKLVFFRAEPASLSALLEGRLRRAFESAGVDFDQHVRFIPRQAPAAFFGLLDRADVFLDSIGFSGFNTVMQAVERSAPIVAFEGEFMRGRFGSAILRQAGLDEWIADTPEGYVDRVARLCERPSEREALRKRMASARAPLFDDRRTVAALGEHLLALTANA